MRVGSRCYHADMLDEPARLSDGRNGAFLGALGSLPGSYDGPDGRQPDPYGLIAFGEAAALAEVVSPWIDARVAPAGTQFLLAAGFDFGEVATLRISLEIGGAKPLVVGADAYEPDFNVPPGSLSTYTYLSYLAYATGHADALAEAEHAMRRLLERVVPDVPTDTNPAKTLAWSLWNRVPLLLSGRSGTGLQMLVQQTFARVGKSLTLTAGPHAIGFVAGAFEAKHRLGDDVVGLVVGPQNDETALAREILATRVAQIEHLEPPDDIPLPADPVAAALVRWYHATWIAAYLARLHEQDAAEADVYRAVRETATERA